MIQGTIFVIRSFASALSIVLNIQIPVSEGSYIYVKDIVLYIFLLFMFVKFFAVVTHNQTINRKE